MSPVRRGMWTPRRPRGASRTHRAALDKPLGARSNNDLVASGAGGAAQGLRLRHAAGELRWPLGGVRHGGGPHASHPHHRERDGGGRRAAEAQAQPRDLPQGLIGIGSMNFLDRVLGYVAPQAGLRRARHRAAIATLARSYEGARVGRRTEGWVVAGSSANAEIGWRHQSRCATARAIWCATTRMRRRRCRRWSATWSAPAFCHARDPAMPASTKRPTGSGPASRKPATPTD